MRAKHVSVGGRVRIIAGVDKGKFGTIEGTQDNIIAVRADNERFARHYVSNQIKRIEKLVR